MIRTIVPVLTWSVIMSLSVAAALNSHRLWSRDGIAVARLAAVGGVVQFRQDGTALWTDAIRNQFFVEGDVVATDKDSRARIVFTGGREIALDERSQVVISNRTEVGESDVVVTLVKGSLQSPPVRAAASRSNTVERLVIRSGSQGVVLKSRDAVKVTKDLDAMRPQVAVVAGAPAIKPMLKAPTPVLASVTAARGAVEIEATPITLPAPGAASAATGAGGASATGGSAPGDRGATESSNANPSNTQQEVEVPAEAGEGGAGAADDDSADKPVKTRRDGRPPQIAAPRAGVTLWTARSLKRGKAPALPIAMALTGPLDREAPPTLYVFKDGKRFAAVSARPTRGRLVAMVSPEVLRGVGRGVGNAHGVRLVVRPGLGDQVDAGGRAELRLASLADVPDGGATLLVDELAFAKGHDWIEQEGTVGRSSARYVLSLKASDDLLRLESLIRGVKRFSVVPAAMSAKSASLYVVRDDSLVARLDTREAAPVTGELSRLRKLLGADMVFRGRGADFLGRSPPSGWSKPLYVATLERRLEIVHASLLQRHAAALGFVARHAAALFAAASTLVDPPAAPASTTVPPDARSWANELDAGAKRLPTGVPRRLVFVESAARGKVPKFLSVDSPSFNRLGVFQVAEPDEMNLTLKLNPNTIDGETDKGEIVRQILAMSDADAVIVAARGDPIWRVLTMTAGKPRKLFDAPAPKDLSAASVHRWAMRAFKLDGVVLARRGDFVLAEAPAYLTAAGKQALVFGESLAGGPSAIVEEVGAVGGLAVFRLMLAAPNRGPVAGGRLLIE